VSGLAEGADQIAAKARPNEWKLHAVLPFSRTEYEKDFTVSADGSGRDARSDYRALLDRCDLITESGLGRNDPHAYLHSGLLMLSLLDVLVAVWDGKSAAGLGGTADIVRAAADAGTPVLWLNNNDPGEICLLVRNAIGSGIVAIYPSLEIDTFLGQWLGRIAGKTT
jgi:hypothetical protein